MKLCAAVLALALGGCGPDTPPWHHATAQNGKPWDPRCRMDLSHVANPVLRLPREALVAIYQDEGIAPLGHGNTINGLYDPLDGTIRIANDLTGWQLADTLHWERCRAWLHQTTGSPLMAHERR